MDKETILIDEINYVDVFNSLKYGYIYVTYKDDNTRMLFNEMITVINELFDSWVVEEKKAVIHEDNGVDWIPIEVDNVYQVIYKSKDKQLPVIHQDNYNIERLAKLASESQDLYTVNEFEPRLLKYAKRLSNKYNVKWTGDGFSGKIKAISVRSQIEAAFLSGKYSISFPSSDFNAQTIRNHASAYSSVLGKKIKVELKFGEIIVHFKVKPESELLLDLAKETFNKIGDLIGENERYEFFNKLLGNNKPERKLLNVSFVKELGGVLPIPVKPSYVVNGVSVSAEEWMQQPIWIRQGYATEEDMNNDF